MQLNMQRASSSAGRSRCLLTFVTVTALSFAAAAVVRPASASSSGISKAGSSSKPDLTITHRVTFTISQGNRQLGNVVLGLFGRVAPRTVQNFVEIAEGRHSKKYEGTIFHRVIPNFMLQGGDVENKKGLGSWSIYGPRFEDENFVLKHDEPYMLSMANAGKDTNGSQFFITTVPTPWLDGKHVVFGKVIEGIQVVQAIENTDTDKNDAPLSTVRIIKSSVEALTAAKAS